MEKLYRIIYKTGVVLFCIILMIYALVQARTLLYPLVLAVLFSYLLYPIGKWLEKRGCHRILANCIIILGCLTVILGVAYILYTEAGLLLRSLPDLRAHAEENILAITSSVSRALGLSTAEFKVWANAQLHYVSESGNVFIDVIFPSTAGTLMALGLVPVYIFLFLYYRNKLYNFLIMIWPVQKKAWLHNTVDEISSITRRYMGGVFTVVAILCVINSLGLYILGLKFALLLGITSALCNFVPYFGVWIGAVLPLTMAVFTGDSPQQAVGVLVLFIFVDLIENNILTPNITGGAVQVNPLVTIIGIIGAGMIWGIPGMFVIIPLLGILKTVLDNNETTKPVGFLIGTEGTAKHAITMKKLKAFFNRRSGSNSGSKNKSASKD